MVDPQIPAPRTVADSTGASATRRDDLLSLNRLRDAVPLHEHTEQLAARNRADAAERALAASEAKVRELEPLVSKAATLDQAHQHDLALADHKHALALESQRQQWALDDARKERDRQLVEVERARSAVEVERHVVEVRKQCVAIAAENAGTSALIVVERERIMRTSFATGGTAALIVGIILGAARQGGSSSPGLVGLGGVVASILPIVAPHLLGSRASLPTPSTSSGWDTYFHRLVADRDQLQGELATLRATTLSAMPLIAAMVGGGTVGFAIGAHGSGPTRRPRPFRTRTNHRIARRRASDGDKISRLY